MKRSGLIAFYVLTFASAWGLAAAFGLFPKQLTAVFGPISLWNPIVFLAVWSPSIFALVLALGVDGKAGLYDLLARIFRWRVGFHWYLISTVGVAGLALTARFVQARFAHTPPPPVLDFASWPHLAWYGLTMLVVDPGPIGEDPGWRGFALPRMLKEFHPTMAALLLGCIWAVWHIPAFFFSGMPQSGLPIGWFMLAVVSLTVLMTWVTIGAGGAVIPAILVHWAGNRFSDLGPDGAMYCAIAYTLAAIAVIVVTRGRLGAPAAQRAFPAPLRPMAGPESP